MEKINYRLARLEDDNSIRAFLNSITMESDIEVNYGKEPSFFEAINIRGYKNQVIIGEKDNLICSMGARALSKNYLNGKIETMGYLSDLKINNSCRHLRALATGYDFVKSLMEDNEAKLHITTIIEDNKKAKIVLTWKNKSKTIPNYYDFGLLNTYFILPIFKHKIKSNFTLKLADNNNLQEIINFLNKEGSKKQFFPVITEEYIASLPGLSLSDFFIAYQNEEIVGVMANWNQTSFRQVIMKKYRNKAKILKYLPFLPKENKEIMLSYVSFFALKDNDGNIFEFLLSNIHKQSKLPIAICLHEKDNLNIIMKKYFKIIYKSRLYIADYKTDEEIAKLTDDRIPYIELGLL